MDQFKKLFLATATYHHRHKVWNDFITVTGIAIHNANKNFFCNELEEQYHSIIKNYHKEDISNFRTLFHMLPDIFESSIDDHLGKLYMELNISNTCMGQYFTPFEVSRLVAKLTFDRNEIISKGYVNLSEPSIGSGGMILAFAKTMREEGYNYQQQLVVHGIDLDSTAAWMAYIQLSLYGIAAEINIGNTLTLSLRRKMFTPMYHFKRWDLKVGCFYDHVKDLMMVS